MTIIKNKAGVRMFVMRKTCLQGCDLCAPSNRTDDVYDEFYTNLPIRFCVKELYGVL